MKKSFNFILMGLMAFSLVSLNSCKKDDDDDDDEQQTGIESFIGSYNFTVTTETHTWSNPLQQCESETETETHLITINDTYNDGVLAANQLVIKNLVKNSNTEVVIDITDNSFVITEPDWYNGTGTKSGNTITIEFTYSFGSCPDPNQGNGTAVKN